MKNRMKHRKKNSNNKRGTTIGVMGIGVGAGTTTIAIALAHYLQSMGYKVAILEMCKRDAFTNLEDYVKGTSSEQVLFRYKGVDYYKKVEDYLLYQILPKNYDYYLYDLGNGRNAIKEMIRSDYKIVVMLHSEWRDGEIVEFCQAYQSEEWFQDIILVNNLHCKSEEKKKWKNQYNIPLVWDKYKVAPEIRRVFREIIELY